MCLNPQAAGELGVVEILHSICGEIINLGFPKALEGLGDLIVLPGSKITATKPVTRFFLPPNEFLIDLKGVAFGKKSQVVETLHTMVGLNVDGTFGTKLNIGNTTSFAGFKCDAQEFQSGHAGLKHPQLLGLGQGGGLLLSCTHE